MYLSSLARRGRRRESQCVFFFFSLFSPCLRFRLFPPSTLAPVEPLSTTCRFWFSNVSRLFIYPTLKLSFPQSSHIPLLFLDDNLFSQQLFKLLRHDDGDSGVDR